MKTFDISSRDHYQNKVFPSPFHRRQAEHNENREWSRWYDYLSVPSYTDATMEYFAGRNTCGVFDLTPMTKHRITGPDALPFLNRLVTRDVAKIKPGRVGYAVWCDDNGRVIDDGTIFHLSEGDYRLCSQEHQIDWLLINARGFDVDIVEDTHDVAGLALQGPTSAAVLRHMGISEVDELTPFGLVHVEFEGLRLMISRTGFTGDLGYELWVDPEHAEPLWDHLFAAGELLGIQAMGSEALEMLRIEAGYIMAGADFAPALHTVRPDNTRSPLELGLGWLVHFDKPVFNGRKALLAEKEQGSRYALVRLDIEDNKPAEHSYVYDTREKNIGWITSAMWSPSAKKNIALATVKASHGKTGERMLVEIYYQRELAWHRKMAKAEVVEGPFWDPPRRRATPPGDW
ncbi:MAG: aminomethyltransferase family protein [Pseudomonadota bacterium]